MTQATDEPAALQLVREWDEQMQRSGQHPAALKEIGNSLRNSAKRQAATITTLQAENERLKEIWVLKHKQYVDEKAESKKWFDLFQRNREDFKGKDDE